MLQDASSTNLTRKSLSSQTSTNTSSDERKQGKAQLVRTLLHNYGFTQTDISKVSRVSPLIFAVDPDRILLPKIEFFRSTGVADADLPKILTAHSGLLSSSLTRKLIPNHNFRKDLLLTHELALTSFYRCPRLLSCDVKKITSPNTDLLRRAGVPHRFIIQLLGKSPASLLRNPHKFKGSVDEVIKMGFNPIKLAFVLAVRAFCKWPEKTRDRKTEVYGRFGLSHEEIWALLRLRPSCLDHSDQKIAGIMNFLVHEMKLPPSVVVNCPSCFYA